MIMWWTLCNATVKGLSRMFPFSDCPASTVPISDKWRRMMVIMLNNSMLFHQNAARLVLTAVLRMIIPQSAPASCLGSALATSLTAAPLQYRNCNTKQLRGTRRYKKTIIPSVQYDTTFFGPAISLRGPDSDHGLPFEYPECKRKPIFKCLCSNATFSKEDCYWFVRDKESE